MRKEVSMVRKRIDTVNRELKPLGLSCQKKVRLRFWLVSFATIKTIYKSDSPMLLLDYQIKTQLSRISRIV